MVFSDADPSIGISSILSRYSSASSTAPPPPPSNSRPLPPKAPPRRVDTGTTSTNGATLARPATTPTNGSRPPFPASGTKASTATSSARPAISGSGATTTSAVTSSKTDAGAIVKKRKIEETTSTSTSSVVLGNIDKKREMLAKMRAGKEGTGVSARPTNSTNSTAAASSSNGASKPKVVCPAGKTTGSTSTGTTPTSAAPKKASYKELLAAAAQAQAEKKHLPGTITHKARPPVVEKKAWQKKLAEQQQAKAGGDRISRSPGVASVGEKGAAAVKKPIEPGKGIPAKKGVDGTATEARKLSVGGVNGSTSSKAKLPDKKSAAVAETGVKRRRLGERDTPPKTSYKNGYGSTFKKGNPKYDRYNNEYEVDGFVVDDDEDERPGYFSKRYTYYDSEYDSGSDMEATGADILEEEERSRRTAIKEDLEQEKLEKQLAAKKAAMKKKLVKK